jgi:hypothetical protein
LYNNQKGQKCVQSWRTGAIPTMCPDGAATTGAALHDPVFSGKHSLLPPPVSRISLGGWRG